MRYKQNEVLVSLVCPSLLPLVLWGKYISDCTPMAGTPVEEQGVPFCWDLPARHPSRCSVVTYGRKSIWKVDLFPAWRFLQHKVVSLGDVKAV